MRRLLSIIICCVLMCGITACGRKNPKKDTACVDNTNNDIGVDAKIDLYDSVEALEQDAACIVIGSKVKTKDTICSYDENENWIGGFTLSDFEISEVIKDDTDTLKYGDHITVLENEVYDEKSNKTYHIADYTMMNTRDKYVLYLSHNTNNEIGEYYTPLAVVFGITSLGDDYKMHSYSRANNTDPYDHKEVDSLREMIREKFSN